MVHHTTRNIMMVILIMMMLACFHATAFAQDSIRSTHSLLSGDQSKKGKEKEAYLQTNTFSSFMSIIIIIISIVIITETAINWVSPLLFLLIPPVSLYQCVYLSVFTSLRRMARNNNNTENKRFSWTSPRDFSSRIIHHRNELIRRKDYI